MAHAELSAMLAALHLSSRDLERLPMLAARLGVAVAGAAPGLVGGRARRDRDGSDGGSWTGLDRGMARRWIVNGSSWRGARGNSWRSLRGVLGAARLRQPAGGSG